MVELNIIENIEKKESCKGIYQFDLKNFIFILFIFAQALIGLILKWTELGIPNRIVIIIVLCLMLYMLIRLYKTLMLIVEFFENEIDRFFGVN